MMKQLNLILLFALFTALFLMTSCGDDDAPEPGNDEEEITTLKITFQKVGSVGTQTFTWRDLDGPGGNPPVIDPITLDANSTYSATIQVLNENEDEDLENEEYNVTLEILEEDDEHQFFYIISSGLNLTHTYQDQDGNGRPIGISNRFVTGAASTGTLRVVLRHELNKEAAGVANGNIANAGGDTDIDVTFQVAIR